MRNLILSLVAVSSILFACADPAAPAAPASPTGLTGTHTIAVSATLGNSGTGTITDITCTGGPQHVTGTFPYSITYNANLVGNGDTISAMCSGMVFGETFANGGTYPLTLTLSVDGVVKATATEKDYFDGSVGASVIWTNQ